MDDKISPFPSSIVFTIRKIATHEADTGFKRDAPEVGKTQVWGLKNGFSQKDPALGLNLPDEFVLSKKRT